MEVLYSLVVVFSLNTISAIEKQYDHNHSIVAQENLTEQLCVEKANEMSKKVFVDMKFPFRLRNQKSQLIMEMVEYVCVPTKLEPKEEE